MTFLHIGIFYYGPSRTKDLQEFFNTNAVDWIRYADNCWIVYSDKTPQWWTEYLNPRLGTGDQFVIVQIYPSTYWGMHQDWVWKWFQKEERNRP